MSMSDPISDLLTRIRNGLRAGHNSVEVPASRIKEEICAVLKREGFIGECELIEDENQGKLRITLKYTADRRAVVRGIRRVSKPSLRVYAKSSEIPSVCSGLGISVLSTSAGVITGKQARDAKVGGEVLCEVW